MKNPVILITISLILIPLLSCDQGASHGDGRAAQEVATTPAPAPTTETTQTDGSQDTLLEGELTFQSVSSETLFTSETVDGTCAEVTFKAASGETPVANIKVSFEILGEGELLGSLSSEQETTSTEGTVVTTYCSGAAAGERTILAKSGEKSANSSKITVTLKPVFTLAYTDYEITGPEVSEEAITLNLADAGPADCATVIFTLLRNESGVGGETVRFQTEIDYPKGMKLASKSGEKLTDVDPKSNKSYSYYVTQSNNDGLLRVPVCAGPTLGTTKITGYFTDDDGVLHTALSPVIRVTGGLTNHLNLSLTFDQENARTVRGYFNTNSDHVHPFTVKLGARGDGDPIAVYPVSVLSETGKIVVANNGIPKGEGAGTVDFTFQALHMANNYAYQMVNFGDTAAQTRCDPAAIAAAGGSTFKNLSSNWRSTVTYLIRGQEAFRDANSNGVYDEGGDGFWDKNQDGYYTAGVDELTYDAGNNGFDINGEWFIDLPSPFVDVDENGVFDAEKDILIGDTYQAPNGKRDSDSLIWKNEIIPIYMGVSTYSLFHSSIPSGAFNPATASHAEGTAYYADLVTKGYLASAPTLYSQATIEFTTTAKTTYWTHDVYFFAQGVCGNPIPGGTDLKVEFTLKTGAKWGERKYAGYFNEQPGDQILEKSRQLLASVGGSETKFNFNAVDHKAKDASYPVLVKLELESCTNQCTGAVNPANPGNSCDEATHHVHLKIGNRIFTKAISYDAVNACNCASQGTGTGPAVAGNGTCTCPNDDEYNSATGQCDAPPP